MNVSELIAVLQTLPAQAGDAPPMSTLQAVVLREPK